MLKQIHVVFVNLLWFLNKTNHGSLTFHWIITDVDADLVLCALYFEVSIPASTNVVLIHRLTVSGETALWGLV